MAGITLTQAQAQLDAYLAASLAVTKNQAYSIGSESFTRADLGKIQAAIIYWQNMVMRLSSRRVVRIEPQW